MDWEELDKLVKESGGDKEVELSETERKKLKTEQETLLKEWDQEKLKLNTAPEKAKKAIQERINEIVRRDSEIQSLLGIQQ